MRPIGSSRPRAVLGVVVPPEFEWGPVTGTTAGELLHVGYSGATVVGAVLVLADGRELTMTVEGGELTVLLPYDTPEGPATVTATLADLSTRTLIVALHGTIVVPPVTPGVGPARARQRRKTRRVLSSPSRIELRSSTRLRVTQTRVAVIELRSSTRVQRTPAPPDRVVRVDEQIRVVVGARQRVRQRAPATVQFSASGSLHRRDGPRLEEALLLLELV